VVFSGSIDGAMRAFDAQSGKVIWEFNTNREFQTVNGVRANGGAIDGPGAVVVNGMDGILAMRRYVVSGFSRTTPVRNVLVFRILYSVRYRHGR